MIHEELKKLGFGDKEIAIYLAILERGKIAATELAKITKINRTTVYSICKELIDKGVITQDLGGTTTYFLANPPSSLNKLAAREEKELETKKQSIKKAVEELALLPKSDTYSIPKIRFIEEADMDNFMRQQTPTWNASLMQKDATWWGFQDPSYVEHYKDYINWYWKVSPKEISLKLLSSENEFEKQMKDKVYERREIKFWKNDLNFTATHWVIGDYVIMIITKQKPHYLVEIHDAVMAHNMREVFRNIWSELK